MTDEQWQECKHGHTLNPSNIYTSPSSYIECRTCRYNRSKLRIRNRSPEYIAWSAMIQRCINPKNPKYKNYGGRGIKVCSKWRNSYQTFLSDIGYRPSKNHSIGRINNDGNYEPSNCRWEINEQQYSNMTKKRNNSSGRRGVTWDSQTSKWRVSLIRKGIRIEVGRFDLIEDAITKIETKEYEYGLQ